MRNLLNEMADEAAAAAEVKDIARHILSQLDR